VLLPIRGDAYDFARRFMQFSPFEKEEENLEKFETMVASDEVTNFHHFQFIFNSFFFFYLRLIWGKNPRIFSIGFPSIRTIPSVSDCA
jgi:hypothetical protein